MSRRELPLSSIHRTNFYDSQEPDFIQHTPLVDVGFATGLDSLTNQYKIRDHPGLSQIQYRLTDLDVVPFCDTMDSEGTVRIHLPDYRIFEVSFFSSETTLELRESILKNHSFDTSKYYLVCRDGIMENSRTLGSYFIKPGSDILLSDKQISKQTKKRDFIIQQRQKRKRDPNLRKPKDKKKIAEKRAKMRKELHDLHHHFYT